MLENFAVLHSSGRCLFLRNYGGEALTSKLVSGLTSYLSFISSATAKGGAKDRRPRRASVAGGASEGAGGGGGEEGRRGEGNGSGSAATSAATVAEGGGSAAPAEGEASTVVVHGQKYQCLVAGAVTLVAQGAQSDSDAFLAVCTKGVRDIVNYFLGEFAWRRDDHAAFDGVLDLVHAYLERLQTDMTCLAGGSKWVFIEADRREEADRLLVTLEENQGVVGSALVLGRSVVHARLPALDTRMLLHYLAVRPLRPAEASTVPVYSGGEWKHMVLFRLRGMTLAVFTRIVTPFHSLAQFVEDLDEQLADTAAQLPVEEPPVLLRHYTGHDTLGFVYYNLQTGVAVAPPPRPGPRAEQRKTTGALTWFCSRALQALVDGSLNEAVLHGRGYRFYALVTPTYHMFALFSDRVPTSALGAYAKEIVDSVQHHVGNVSAL